MKPRLRAVMELVRLPNLLTALADVWAGFFLAGGTSADVAALATLSVASMLLYAGGMALNDVCDARRDATLRPERPIPSGRLSRAAAARLAIVLLGGGLAAAACLSVRSASIAGALVASIVLYDAVLKTTPLAPGVMGLCRALNLMLGLSVVPIVLGPATLAPVALVWLYVASLTLFARRESVANGRAPLSVALVGVLLAVVGQAFLVALPSFGYPGFVVGSVTLGAACAWYGIRAVRDPTPEQVQRAVKLLVVGIVVFDACLAWAARGMGAGIIVAALLVPTLALGRRFRMT